MIMITSAVRMFHKPAVAPTNQATNWKCGGDRFQRRQPPPLSEFRLCDDDVDDAPRMPRKVRELQ